VDAKLFDFIQSKCPKMNTAITRGLACAQLAHAEAYIDRIMRCAEDGFPPGLKYLGYQRCTPKEAYEFASAKKNNKQTFEFTKSDIYLVKYFFSWNGEELKPRYIYLPFVSEAGLITIMGSVFSISPVLADRAVSVGDDYVFIPLNRDKLTFRRCQHHYLSNGVRQTGSVIWSNIHHASKKNNSIGRKTITANAALAHYLFCKYGLRRTFSQYANVEVRAGMPDEINETTYPPSEWHIFHSMETVKPPGVRRQFYVGPKARLAIRRSEMNEAAENLIAGFFYVADRFPERMDAEYFDHVDLWRTLLGHVIYANDELDGKLLNKVNLHMSSLDGYIDGMVRNTLADDGIVVHDVYDLFMYIIDSYSTLVTGSASGVSSMYGKRLMVLRYVLIDVIKAIFGMMFALQVNTKKAITKNDILNVMQRFLKPLLIIKINHKHGEVSSVSNPTDNMSWKVTANIVLQSNIGSAGGSKSITIDSSKILHASIAEVGQYNNLPKGEPTGRTRVNPFAVLGPEWSIERNPELAEVIDATQAGIER